MQKVFTLFQLISYVAAKTTPTTTTTTKKTTMPRTTMPRTTMPKTTMPSTTMDSTPVDGTTMDDNTEDAEHATRPTEPSEPDLPEFRFFEGNRYPFLVFIHVKLPNGLSGNCVGTLIEPSIVLTSAHCTFDIPPKHIMVYNHYFNKKHMRHVSHVYQHKSYNDRKQDHDISILKLKNTFEDTRHIIEMSGSPNEFLSLFGTLSDCVIVGFSLESILPDEHVMRLGYLGYNATIESRYGPDKCPTRTSDDLWEKWLCSKSDKQIQFLRNRGSPLICNGYQYGVFSHSLNGLADKGVEMPDIENYYVFIHFYRDWIKKTIKKSTGNLIIPNVKLFIISVMIFIYNFSQKN